MLTDIRYALRMRAKSPAFTAVAGLVLAAVGLYGLRRAARVDPVVALRAE